MVGDPATRTPAAARTWLKVAAARAAGSAEVAAARAAAEAPDAAGVEDAGGGAVVDLEGAERSHVALGGVLRLQVGTVLAWS